ncbi:MAG: 50S ribosomal protein L15 [Pseudomonadota bacterium]
MSLNDLRPAKGAKKNRKRIGRGESSGQGKTAGKGSKGQKARSGGNVAPGFEGGQMPLQRRLPKRGFKNIFRKEYAIVNIRDLARCEVSEISPEEMKQAGLIKKNDKLVKVLGVGEIDKAVSLSAHKISKAALDKIQKAGGKVEVIAG